jgi:hypothetical protein
MKWMRSRTCALIIAIASGAMLCGAVHQTAASAAPAAKPMPPAQKSLTGKYISKANHGELYVLEEPDQKIKFGLTALWVGPNPGNVNTGATSGIVPIKDGEATYKNGDSGYTIKMHFGRNAATISYTGDGFGGLNVDPAGTYKKVNSKTPTQSELNPSQ